MKRALIIVGVLLAIVFLGLFFYSKANAKSKPAPGGTLVPAVPAEPVDCQGICQGICKKHPAWFSGRQKCKNKCTSDCTVGTDVKANAENY